MSVNWQSFDLQTNAQIFDGLSAEAWPLFLAAAIAGLVDSIGGGGGLITVPALLNIGIPVHLILGTNKCLATIGSLPAVVRYARAGLLPQLHGGVWVFLFITAAAVAAIGARCSQNPWVLENLPILIPCLLFFVIAFMIKRWFLDEAKQRRLLPKNMHDFDSEAKIQQRLFHPLALGGLLSIAAYDGILGPGTGTFFLSLFERLGLRTITANAMTKIFNLASNIGALIWFGSQGRLIWSLGIATAAFYLCGSYLGSGLVLKRGQKLVRIVVIVTSSGLLLKQLVHIFSS